MAFCSNCGGENGDGARFCSKCGRSQEGTVLTMERPAASPPVAAAPVATPPSATPPKKRGFVRRHPFIALIVAIIVAVAIATSANSGSKSPPSGSSNSSLTTLPSFDSSSTDTSTDTSSVDSTSTDTSADQAAAPVAPPAVKVLLDLKGNGIKTSKKFTTAGDDWTIHYSYNCSGFGYAGNFQIYINDSGGSPVDVAANELAMKGSDSSEQHQGGTFYLEMNSECSWHVKVIG